MIIYSHYHKINPSRYTRSQIMPNLFLFFYELMFFLPTHQFNCKCRCDSHSNTSLNANGIFKWNNPSSFHPDKLSLESICLCITALKCWLKAIPICLFSAKILQETLTLTLKLYISFGRSYGGIYLFSW